MPRNIIEDMEHLKEMLLSTESPPAPEYPPDLYERIHGQARRMEKQFRRQLRMKRKKRRGWA